LGLHIPERRAVTAMFSKKEKEGDGGHGRGEVTKKHSLTGREESFWGE